MRPWMTIVASLALGGWLGTNDLQADEPAFLIDFADQSAKQVERLSYQGLSPVPGKPLVTQPLHLLGALVGEVDQKRRLVRPQVVCP